MDAPTIKKSLMDMNTKLTDQEWRIFQEWQRVVPYEPFYAFNYASVLKRAIKEGIPTDNLFSDDTNVK